MAIKKHVLIITGVFPPEPVVSASLLFDLATELSKKYLVTVLRPFPSRPHGFKFTNSETDTLPFKVEYLKSFTYSKSFLLGRFVESYSMGKHSVAYIKKFHSEIDLIYNAPWQLFGRFMVAKSSLKFGIPYVTPVQDIYPESIASKLPKWNLLHKLINKVLLPFDKTTLTNAAKIHAISNKMKYYLAGTRSIDINRFVVIHNWQNEYEFINFQKENKKLNSDMGSSFTFMYMGNVGPLAGLEFVIQAFAEANIINCKLIIAGAGSTKEKLKAQALKLSNNNIEFWEVPKGKVPEIQSKADVMILPIKKGYSSSSIPSKFPAYLFSSKPVLACVDVNSDIAQAIVKAKCGWISEPENTEKLSERFKDILHLETNILEMMGKRGFEYAIDHFSRKKNLPKLSLVCEQILNSKQL